MQTSRKARFFFTARPRMTIAIGIGLLIALLFPFPHTWSQVTRILFSWNIAAWGYILLLSGMMLRAEPEQIKEITERENNNSAIVILAVLSIAAILSITAIVYELSSARKVSGSLRLVHYLFTAATVMGAWFLVAFIYTFHYAHLYYRSPEDKRALRFPENELQPDYWDFLYFSFTIAVAAQTSDITVVSREMRKVVLAQSLLSFFFNVTIIGLSINIASGALAN